MENGGNGNTDGRSRILEASLKVFARKGFDGSRIDEIAREAGVPKSLIYYHFKSKDEILEVLTRRFIEDYTRLIRCAKDDTRQQKAEKLPLRLRSLYVQFERNNADLIRVMLIESLKKTQKKPILFKIVQSMIDVMEEAPVNQGADFNVQQELAAEFFTRMIPDYAYICFSDAWSEYFGIDKTRLDELFVGLIAETHGAYHKSSRTY